MIKKFKLYGSILLMALLNFMNVSYAIMPDTKYMPKQYIIPNISVNIIRVVILIIFFLCLFLLILKIKSKLNNKLLICSAVTIAFLIISCIVSIIYIGYEEVGGYFYNAKDIFLNTTASVERFQSYKDDAKMARSVLIRIFDLREW